MSLTTKVKIAKFLFLNEKSYNKTLIDIIKSDILLSLAASVNYHFFGKIHPYVYLIEVNNCILSFLTIS